MGGNLIPDSLHEICAQNLNRLVLQFEKKPLSVSEVWQALTEVWMGLMTLSNQSAAVNRRPAGQSGGSGKFVHASWSRRAFPEACSALERSSGKTYTCK